MTVMAERNKAYKLKGAVQVDDAYLGGERRGTPGRGAKGKIPFIAAVETHSGKPAFIKLRPVAAFTKKAVLGFAQEAIEPSSDVISDGLSCFESFAKAGMTHTAMTRGRASRRIVDPRFKWVNIALGNVKAAITGPAGPSGRSTPGFISPPMNIATTASISARCFPRLQKQLSGQSRSPIAPLQRKQRGNQDTE